LDSSSAFTGVPVSAERSLISFVTTCFALDRPPPMDASRSSADCMFISLAAASSALGIPWLPRPRPFLRSTLRSSSRPDCRSSSRLILEKNERILLRAEEVLTMFIQSREGVPVLDVRISTRSPIWSS